MCREFCVEEMRSIIVKDVRYFPIGNLEIVQKFNKTCIDLWM